MEDPLASRSMVSAPHTCAHTYTTHTQGSHDITPAALCLCCREHKAWGSHLDQQTEEGGSGPSVGGLDALDVPRTLEQCDSMLCFRPCRDQLFASHTSDVTGLVS